VRLPRGPGQKEDRYAHLLGGPVTASTLRSESSDTRAPRRVSDEGTVAHDVAKTAASSEISALRSELEALRGEVSELHRALDDLREQLGA
jgi:uncharacterized protein YceH (UPF0502 family)